MPETTMNVGQRFGSRVHKDAGESTPWPACRGAALPLDMPQYHYVNQSITCPQCLAVKP